MHDGLHSQRPVLAHCSFNSTFEDDNRERRSSSPGLEMQRLAPGYSPASTPLTTPRTSTSESPDIQYRKNNRVAPQNSRNELRPSSVIAEVSESGRTSRNSVSSGTVIDAFILKNGSVGNSVDPPAGTSGPSTSNGEREQNASGEHSESGDSSSSGKSNRSRKAKCVIS